MSGTASTAIRQTEPDGAVRVFARSTGLASVVLALVILAGWINGTSAWQQLFFWQIAIKANTAIALALLGVSILAASGSVLPARRRDLIVVLSSIVGSIGGLTLLEYLFVSSVRIDEIFLSAASEAATSATPGRMAAVTAVLLVLFAAALLVDRGRDDTRRRVAQLLLIAVIAISLTMLLSYAHGSIPTFGSGHGLQIAPGTAILLFLLAFAQLLLGRRTGIIAPIFSDSVGGTAARRLLPFAFLIPFSMMVVRALGPAVGLQSVATSSATTAVIAMLAFALLIWTAVAPLERAHRDLLNLEREKTQLADVAQAEVAHRHAAEQSALKLQTALREKVEAHALLDVLLTSAPVGFALLDTNLRFLRVNPAFAAISGDQVGDHIGRMPVEVYGPEVEPIAARLQQILETGDPVLDAKLSVAPGGGTARNWQASAYPLHRANGQVFAIGALVLETTERDRLHSELLQANKMDAVGQLAGGIAHDFNNLLTVIINYSSFLEEELDSQDERRGYAIEIGSAAARAAALTRQLLTFSRKSVVERSLVRIDAVTAGIERLLDRLLPTHVELAMSLGAPDAVALVDPGQWEQVIMNLALNASDAMPGGGRLSLKSSVMEVDDLVVRMVPGLAPGSYVAVEVSDTGSGMTPEIRERIFEPFFTTKSLGKGTGLGLSIAFGVVRDHGGSITVYSEPGVGTVFRVYLPLVDSAAVSSAQTAGIVAGGNEVVMVVDDDEAVRAAIRESLKRLGYRVLVAGDGADALQLAGLLEEPPDLVLTDVMMPGVGGREFAEQLMRSGHVNRVLLMSGYAEGEAVNGESPAGRLPFLQKPFSRESLARKVRQAIDDRVHA